MSARGGRSKREKDINVGRSDGRKDSTDKAGARPKPKPDASLPQVDDGNKQMYERTLYMTMNLVGRVVQVQVKSGATYEGIFHTATTDKGFGVVLKMARKKEAGSATLGAPVATIIIQPKDFVQLIANEVSFDSGAPSDDVFMTDTDISGHADMKERELQPWVPDSDVSIEMNLNTVGYGKTANWDQFEVNEKLFGVRTTFEEELYTTKLDKDAHSYAERSRMAQRIADEIEGKVASNAHLAEERGQIGTEDMDEEEKYSSVIRSGVYVPPGKRSQPSVAPADSKDLKASTEENKAKLGKDVRAAPSETKTTEAEAKPAAVTPSPAVPSASTSSTAPSTSSTSAPSSTSSTPATSAPSSTSSSSTAASTPSGSAASSSSTASSSSSTLTLRPLSKLNPNAKAFTPMSANAPVFTPKSFVPASQQQQQQQQQQHQQHQQPQPAPSMPPPEHAGMFHPMQHPHHPQPHYPHHMQHPAPLAVDPRPISEIYCDSMKRKNHQEKSENTPPYWFGMRGPYKSNVEDMDPSAMVHRGPPHQGPPFQPSAGMPIGVVHIPHHPHPQHPQHPHPQHPHPHPSHMAPSPFPPYVMPPPVGMMSVGPPMGAPQPGPIFVQPGMRPFHPGVVGMAPGQPPYVYSQMGPLSPPIAHQTQPQSPQHQGQPQSPSPHSSSSSSSSSAPSAQSPQQPHHSHMYPPPPFSPSHPHTPPPHHSPSPSHAVSVSSPSPSSPTPAVGSPLGPKRTFYPHSPTQPPQSPQQSPHSPKPGYVPTQPRT